MEDSVTGQKKAPRGEGGNTSRGSRVLLLLSGFQGDDDENGTPVHPAHAAGVAHEVVQDGGEFCPHLSGNTTGSVSEGPLSSSSSALKRLRAEPKRRTRSQIVWLKNIVWL